MQLVKNDLGGDAVIVSTQNVKEGKAVFGLFGKSMVEIVAARDDGSVLYRRRPANRPPVALPAEDRFPAETGFHQLLEENSKSSAAFLTTRMIRSAIAPLKEQINELRAELGAMGNSQQDGKSPLVRDSLASLLLQDTEAGDDRSYETVEDLRGWLLKGGVNEQIIEHISEKVLSSDTPDENEKDRIERFVEQLASLISISPDIPGRNGSPTTIALVGPTGVGKTTTLAKIGAKKSIDDNCNVAFITLDNFRIGAIDQLEKYVNIIGAPLEVANSPRELALLLKKFSGCDLILIDTVGRSQRDTQMLDELSEFFVDNPSIDTHLVLSATTQDEVIYEIVKNFERLSINKYIFTKLDEAKSYGQMVNILVRTGRPVSFLTNGQKVPQDFAPASKRRICNLLLN